MLKKIDVLLKNKAGFTLLELLVVVAIIGFLSSISILALSSSQEHGRDSQRKLDQLTIIKAAELYVNDFGAPPTQLCVTGEGNVCKSTGSTSFLPTQQRFVKVIPVKETSLMSSLFGIPTANALKLYYRTSSECEQYNAQCSFVPGSGWTGSSGCSCGDGAITCNEQCDGGTQSCTTAQGYSGVKSCNSTSCQWNSCVTQESCGDKKINGYEQCDEGNKNDVCPNSNNNTCTTSCTICTSCGDDIIQTPNGAGVNEQCDGSNLNNATCSTISQGFTGGTLSCSGSCQFVTSACTTTPVGPCNGNNQCDPLLGENIGNCPLECGVPVGGTKSCNPNGTCETGETPGNCAADCTNINMCYVSGQWDLCCAFGTNCPAAGPGGKPVGDNYTGYYGVCNGTRCEQRYLQQAPAFPCDLTKSDSCQPNAGNPKDRFVSNSSPVWLVGLEPYIAQKPTPPSRHRLGIDFNKYYVTSDPAIVNQHLLCVYVSFERHSDNFNPYNDLIHCPTDAIGCEDWTPLCLK